MPYNDRGVWVPEWSDSTPHLRPETERLRSAWRRRGFSGTEIEGALNAIGPSSVNETLEELGRDAARAQRDALFSWIALEETKRGGLQPSSQFPYPPTFPGALPRTHDKGDGRSLSEVDPAYLREQEVILDSNAGRVLTRLRMLDLQSATSPTDGGGPPAHTASRPYKRMIEWLLGKLADVGQFLLRIAEVAGRLLLNLAEMEIKLSVHLGLPFPQIGVQIDRASLIVDAEAWGHVTASANG